jgi:F-type H+-transporting ATPase subunit b
MPEINWQNMASQVFTFLIALFIVWKFGWKSMAKFIRERQEKVRKTIDDAENTRRSIAKLEAEYRSRLEGVERKAAEMLAAARGEAARAKEEIVHDAQEEASALRKKGQEQLEQERQRLMAEMRAEIVGLSVAIAEKALAGPLPADMQIWKFEELLEEMKGAQRPS